MMASHQMCHRNENKQVLVDYHFTAAHISSSQDDIYSSGSYHTELSVLKGMQFDAVCVCMPREGESSADPLQHFNQGT